MKSLKELVHQSFDIVLQEAEACFIIQQYVKARKNVHIEPQIDYSMVDTPFGISIHMQQVQLMTEMVNIATVWFRENPDEITKLEQA